MAPCLTLTPLESAAAQYVRRASRSLHVISVNPISVGKAQLTEMKTTRVSAMLLKVFLSLYILYLSFVALLDPRLRSIETVDSRVLIRLLLLGNPSE
jgi:hypothetical protein